MWLVGPLCLLFVLVILSFSGDLSAIAAVSLGLLTIVSSLLIYARNKRKSHLLVLISLQVFLIGLTAGCFAKSWLILALSAFGFISSLVSWHKLVLGL